MRDPFACRCDAWHNLLKVPRPGPPDIPHTMCLQRATQEDGLCDPCRIYGPALVAVRDQLEGCMALYRKTLDSTGLRGWMELIDAHIDATAVVTNA